jgi:hypothetical protein
MLFLLMPVVVCATRHVFLHHCESHCPIKLHIDTGVNMRIINCDRVKNSRIGRTFRGMSDSKANALKVRKKIP